MVWHSMRLLNSLALILNKEYKQISFKVSGFIYKIKYVYTYCLAQYQRLKLRVAAATTAQPSIAEDC